ncbi:hypothetical protein V8C44DRAFT_314609 [Trichoderma aethiopicum]
MAGSSGLLHGQSMAGVVQLIIPPSAAASQMASPGSEAPRTRLCPPLQTCYYQAPNIDM